jgi:hypothetical protein
MSLVIASALSTSCSRAFPHWLMIPGSRKEIPYITSSSMCVAAFSARKNFYFSFPHFRYAALTWCLAGCASIDITHPSFDRVFDALI